MRHYARIDERNAIDVLHAIHREIAMSKLLSSGAVGGNIRNAYG
jgi:hypothetical protein